MTIIDLYGGTRVIGETRPCVKWLRH